ncbi:CAP family protein [Lentzea cavernae]|uniref:SCP domain-containing protein n=1 Tax=Lentzea cavernae TaxID=2020703 RepID=A0ABQ3M376_9PSEU|nr:CAP family protein [Lentzea cavernae]GHH31622.1 hypothetical protein GCM10017774_11550 [Lentzea cavernae]
MLTALATATALLLTTPPTPTTTDPVTKTVHTINAYRAMHGAPPLSLDSEVSRTAQEWADHLHETNDFQHRPGNQYGENLYATSRKRSIDSAAADALEAWYRESRGYDYDEEMTQQNINHSLLHFTAMVWKSTTQVGVGLTQGHNGTYVVINFAKRGNTLNHFRENVLPPTPKPKASRHATPQASRSQATPQASRP